MSGENQERTEWHRVVIFNENLSDVAEKYLRKGSKVFLEGQLQTRKWQDQSGQDRYTTEVVLSRFRGELVMLDGRSDDMSAFEPANSDNQIDNTKSAAAGGKSGGNALPADFDDEIPF